MSGAIHRHPHAFMAQTGTTLHDRILVLSITHYVADLVEYMFRNEWSYTTIPRMPSWHRQEHYSITNISNILYYSVGILL